MRESVLLALIHIFAIVSTVNPVGITSRGRKILRSYLRRYLNRELEEEYYALFENNLEFYSNELKSVDKNELADEDSLISFQITNICRQIKKGLFLEERMLVFLQLLEFAFEDRDMSEQEKNIIDIVARTFNIPKKEYDNASAFMIGRVYDEVTPECILLIESDKPEQQGGRAFNNYDKWHHLKVRGFKGQLFVLHIESTGSLLLTYDGPLALWFKGRDIIACRPYLLERGVNIKGVGIDPIYYSHIYKAFIFGSQREKVVFEGHDIEFRFKNSDNGVQKMNFRVESGNMIAIMGGSGVGKTTMLNLLHGKIKPTSGNLYVNGYDIHEDAEEIKGLIGYVPQDDMLIEELTVYQNLYYNARLCFGDYTEEQLNNTVLKVLADLDLFDIRDLQVGDLLNKKVSGGQRKRLNIGLELMREPVVLFIDEPTSGLSSFDSGKVMNLLKDQSLAGKLVFSIIHQPSSDILKMFDRLWLLDKGGFMIYDGDPVEALVYFKTETSQANATESECPNCGNIDTDNILQIIEVKVINNEGLPGQDRQVSPKEWYDRYRRKMMPPLPERPSKAGIAPSNFRVPGKSAQIKTFIRRNITRKLADRQYMTINLAEAPLLAFILAYISKHLDNGKYLFSTNINYPVFLFMAVIVALFMGLTVSAEEIFRDRKILEREKFLSLSRLSYLISKINFLFALSAIQTLSFVIVASLILEVRGMLFSHWLILFSVACFGNILGLNISAGMRSAVSIYILIPLLLVPQLILGGAMIKFDDLHQAFSRKIYVPVIGDVMATRWAYEALCVEQFKSNRFEKPFFEYDMRLSQNEWNASFLIPMLKVKAEECAVAGKDPEYREYSENNLVKLNYHIKDLAMKTGISPGEWFKDLNYDNYSDIVSDETREWLDSLRNVLRKDSRVWSARRDSVYEARALSMGEGKLLRLRETDYNDRLADFVLNRLATNKIYESEKRLVQKADPVFMPPGSRIGRAHFYAPFKLVGNLRIGTLVFNVAMIWLMTFFLFVTLYFNILKRFIVLLERLNLPLWRKFGRELLFR
ncbi:MAG: ATP-binding cassette domain-containing protein [Bacteroidales bacterium]|nr:ATP-binding cassette domain-containing protein [Bacteroidales bacterium]MBN2632051.1 ATP-binding cassette domain-containing protein [Bacteroidales bacterium]